MSRRAAIRKPRCTMPTRTNSTKSTRSKPPRRSPIPEIRKIRMPRLSMAIFPKGTRRRSIQDGLKETLLSGFVRLYQALDVAGVPVKLDLYEGMVHNFQDRISDAPEAIVARQKIRAFLYQHLGIGEQS